MSYAGRDRPHRLLSSLATVATLVFIGCASTVSPRDDSSPPAVPPIDGERAALGGEIYQLHCSLCHKADLSGEPDWKTPKPDGTYPAPPHDSSGHTWHHSDQLLLTIIRDGLDFGPTNMPTYGGTLTDDEIKAVIAFLKSRWPDEERQFQWQVTWQEAQRASS